jgi:hypothetical protein
MCYILHKFCCFFRRDFCNTSDFNPLGEFVDGHQYIPVAAFGGSERTYRVKAPHGKGQKRGDCTEDLNWQVQLFGKELTHFAPFNEVFGIGHDRGPGEARSVSFTDQVGGCCMAAALTAVNLSQEL